MNYLNDIIEAFFLVEANRVAFFGIWALVAIGAAPFAWGWDDLDMWGEGAPKFDAGPLCLGLMAPIIPFAILAAPILIAAAFLLVGVPHYVSKWWNASWA